MHAELQLKELLWTSLTEWDRMQEQWLIAPFNTIDPEDLNAEVSYLKSSQLVFSRTRLNNGVEAQEKY